MADNLENNQQEQEQEEEKEEKLQCTVDCQDSGPWKKKITITIPRQEIDKALDKQYGEMGHTAEVPGFRKGRAPRRLIEKRYGKDIGQQVKLQLLAKAFEQAEEQNDFEILGEPDFDPEKIELPDTGDMNFDYEIEVKPVFDLPELEGIKIEKQAVEINEERINETLQQLCRRNGTMITVGKAQADDHVSADITMKVEGIDEPEELTDRPIWVSPSTIDGVAIEDMAKVLEGAAPGDTKTCNADVPETHPKEEYRGKKAEFTIKVREIKRLKPAEVNEEFCNTLGVANEAELRRAIEENLEDQADQETRRMMSRQAYKYLEDNTKFELPAGVMERHTGSLLARRYHDLLGRGVPQEEIEQNLEKLRASTSEQASLDLKMGFIMARVAEELEVEVSEGEVNAAIAQMAAMYRRRPEKLRDELSHSGRLDALRERIRDDKAIGRILEMAQVTDVPAEVKEKKKAPARKKAAEAAAEKTEAPAEKPKTKPKTGPESKKKAGSQAETDKKNAKTPRKDVKRKPPSTDSKG
jgi:trigger factor